MEESGILGRIGDLVDQEHALRARSTGVGLSGTEREHLRDVEQKLDQCWDMLRQRRARAEFGENPGDAKFRPTDEVESYEQ